MTGKTIGRKTPASRRTLCSPLQFESFVKKPVASKFPRDMGPAVASSGGKEAPHLFSRSHLAPRLSLLQSFDLAFPLVRFPFEPVAFPPPKKISFVSSTHVLFSRNMISQPSEMALPVLFSESTRLKVTRAADRPMKPFLTPPRSRPWWPM